MTAAELAELKKRGQPDVIINRIQPKINYLLGYEAEHRTDPKGFPRTPVDEKASEACTDALRYEKDATELDTINSAVWENMLIEGYGGLELVIEPSADGQNPNIVVEHWDWDRLFYDPYSRKPDFSDARYIGGVVWMDAEDALQKWPEFKDAIEATMSEATISRTYDDRPLWKKWTTGGKRKRVRIVQMYHKLPDGRWYYCVFTKGGKLDGYDVPFRDQDNKPWCPMFLQSAFVDRENNRYGIVRTMIGVQDEINKRRSKALHRLTMRQVVTERGAVEDEDATKQELAKPDGMVVVNPGFRFEMLNGAEQMAAELQLLQEAKSEIELMGPNSALQGRDENAPSGRAILANQSSGQTEISMLLDRHRHLKKRTYIGLWNLIRQYKTAQWWVRVTDDEQNVKFVGMNRPVTMAEELQKKLEAAGLPPEEIQAKMAEAQADPMMVQQLQQVVRIENNPTEMYMDVTVEEVPDTANVQQEQFDSLVKLAPAVTFPPKVYIQASGLRNKKELIELIDGQGQDPVAAEFAKIQGEQTIKKTEAEIEKLKADALKARVEADKADAEIGMITDPRIVQAGQDTVPSSVPSAAAGMPGAEDMGPPPTPGA